MNSKATDVAVHAFCSKIIGNSKKNKLYPTGNSVTVHTHYYLYV